MVDENSNSAEWSLTLVRSGGYKIDNELNDALFLYGRTSKEILLSKKNNFKQHLPNGVIHLLEKSNLTDLALETGFVVNISINKKNNNIESGWEKFEKVITSSLKKNSPLQLDEAIWGVYSLYEGDRCFEMIGITPEKLPSNVWIEVKPLDQKTLAWVISQDNILTSDDKEQKTLDDFFELNLSELSRSYLTLPGPSNCRNSFLN
tara:strand:+ start:1953 stop:2567 length:615 start_codon:yes stop_codon:yes gene_type:complete